MLDDYYKPISIFILFIFVDDDIFASEMTMSCGLRSFDTFDDPWQMFGKCLGYVQSKCVAMCREYVEEMLRVFQKTSSKVEVT